MSTDETEVCAPGAIRRCVYDDQRGLAYYEWATAADGPGQPGLQQEVGHDLPAQDGWYLYFGDTDYGDGPYTEAEGLQLLWEAGPAMVDVDHA